MHRKTTTLRGAAAEEDANEKSLPLFYVLSPYETTRQKKNKDHP